jgi:hypothetical protein
MSAEEAFKQYKKKQYNCEIPPIDHKVDCTYLGAPIPVSVCGCNCYEYGIFFAGYLAAKGISFTKEKKS